MVYMWQMNSSNAAWFSVIWLMIWSHFLYFTFIFCCWYLAFWKGDNFQGASCWWEAPRCASLIFGCIQELHGGTNFYTLVVFLCIYDSWDRVISNIVFCYFLGLLNKDVHWMLWIWMTLKKPNIFGNITIVLICRWLQLCWILVGPNWWLMRIL